MIRCYPVSVFLRIMAMRTSKAILFVAAVGAAALMGGPREVRAQGSWCSQSFDRDGGGGQNCGFYSFEQCVETARGVGAICTRSLLVPQPSPAAKAPPKKPARAQK